MRGVPHHRRGYARQYVPHPTFGVRRKSQDGSLEYLKNDPELGVDKSIQQKLLITVAPDNFLRRIGLNMSAETLLRVSVGVPVRNGGEFLVAAMRSIIDQFEWDIESISSDNGSEDGTGEYVLKLVDMSCGYATSGRTRRWMLMTISISCFRRRVDIILCRRDMTAPITSTSSPNLLTDSTSMAIQ